jgi:glycosyltransferase involved in cell wall biosynthesis
MQGCEGVSEGKTRATESVLVSVILPVRNGSPMLELVLRGILGQTYTNIEVLISDNASSDSTPEICRGAMYRDSRVRYVRQPNQIAASENFFYWLDKANGRYVIFAAHDDLRSANFIEVSLRRALAAPDAVCVTPLALSFGVYGNDVFAVPQPARIDAFYESSGVGKFSDAARMLHSWGGALIYGLLRRDCIDAFVWPKIEFDQDVPFNVYVVMAGRIVHAPDAMLYYFRPALPKSPLHSAQQYNLTPLRSFRSMRMAVACARATAQAYKWRNRSAWGASFVLPMYALIKWPHVKEYLHRISPVGVRSTWRALKRLVGLPLN